MSGGTVSIEFWRAVCPTWPPAVHRAAGADAAAAMEGRVIAWEQLAAFKTFSLGMGGGVK
jgi:hypothetical protein